MPIRAAAATLAFAMLTACSGAPDAEDIQPLLEQSLRNGLQHARSMAEAIGGESGVKVIEALGAPDPTSVHVERVQILDSRQLGHGDYDMRVRYDVVSGGDREVATRTLHMNETEDGWRLLPEGTE